MKIRVIIVTLMLLTMFYTISCAKNINNIKENNTTILINNLKNEIKQLQNEISELKAKNMRLSVNNQKLQNELNNLKKWDAHILMDKLIIYQITPQGKKYDLLFHVGGMGGVAVYQYVGPWQGDAGKWRQYKQIAELTLQKDGEGFVKPGVVIHPIWGFNNSTIRLHSMYDLIKLENQLNSINGLAKYFEWLRTRYKASSSYNFVTLASIFCICTVFGSIFGEVIQPIRIIVDRITMGVMTDFGEPKTRKIDFLFIGLIISVLIGLYVITHDAGLSAIIGLIVILIVYALRKVIS